MFPKSHISQFDCQISQPIILDMKYIACLVLAWLLVTLTYARAEDPDDSRIIGQILQTRNAIINATGDSNALFLAFWDFDGTTMKGDCSEGLREDGHLVYAGLAQLAIEHGLSEIYPADGGFEKFWNDYTNMDARIGHWLAYPFIAQMLRGAKVDDVSELSRHYFATTSVRPYDEYAVDAFSKDYGVRRRRSYHRIKSFSSESIFQAFESPQWLQTLIT